MKNIEKEYPGNDDNKDLPFESPQTEESKRLSKTETAPAIEKKNKNPDDEGHARGGNQSINQS